MGNFIFLQIFAAVCALSIITTLFNKRILDFPQAIGAVSYTHLTLLTTPYV